MICDMNFHVRFHVLCITVQSIKLQQVREEMSFWKVRLIALCDFWEIHLLAPPQGVRRQLILSNYQTF